MDLELTQEIGHKVIDTFIQTMQKMPELKENTQLQIAKFLAQQDATEFIEDPIDAGLFETILNGCKGYKNYSKIELIEEIYNRCANKDSIEDFNSNVTKFFDDLYDYSLKA